LKLTEIILKAPSPIQVTHKRSNLHQQLINREDKLEFIYLTNIVIYFIQPIYDFQNPFPHNERDHPISLFLMKLLITFNPNNEWILKM